MRQAHARGCDLVIFPDHRVLAATPVGHRDWSVFQEVEVPLPEVGVQ